MKVNFFGNSLDNPTHVVNSYRLMGVRLFELSQAKLDFELVIEG